MSALVYGLLSEKLDEIAALYKVRPRITLIVRMPGKPEECAFLSDDAWPDAVATVERLHCDTAAFKAGPEAPRAEAQHTEIENAYEALRRFDAAQKKPVSVRGVRALDCVHALRQLVTVMHPDGPKLMRVTVEAKSSGTITFGAAAPDPLGVECPRSEAEPDPCPICGARYGSCVEIRRVETGTLEPVNVPPHPERAAKARGKK